MKRKTEFEFPESHKPGVDKYFQRSSHILKKEDINPFVRYQAFIRKPGIVDGIDEAIAAIMHFKPEFAEHGGRIYALNDGDKFKSCETLMYTDGYAQDLIELETDDLSRISGRTSIANGMQNPDLEKVTETVSETIGILEESQFGARPYGYFGARHFPPEIDAQMAKAAFDGGATSCSTDIGAATVGQIGTGTTPHALTITFAMKYGIEDYAVKVMEAFDRHIDSDVPRIFLADTFNREITDTIKVAESLGDKFQGPRFDTNGAVVAQGGIKASQDPTVENIREHHGKNKYYIGRGVTIEGVKNATYALIGAGFPDLENALTSGFSNTKKVQAFVDAEEKYNIKLFGFIGAGLSTGYHTATSDIIGSFDENGGFHELHKVGRPIRPNPRLKEVDLSVYE
jgi:nicotinic acid phosphoribosyltransferase